LKGDVWNHEQKKDVRIHAAKKADPWPEVEKRRKIENVMDKTCNAQDTRKVYKNIVEKFGSNIFRALLNLLASLLSVDASTN
jgi:hypothetical protein